MNWPETVHDIAFFFLIGALAGVPLTVLAVGELESVRRRRGPRGKPPKSARGG